MKSLFTLALCFGLVVPPAYAADSYQALSREYNLIYREFLRNKIEKFPKNIMVELFLKDGTSVKGKFEGFCKYDDGIWIMPLGKHWLFSDEAYDIRQIQDISIIKKEI